MRWRSPTRRIRCWGSANFVKVRFCASADPALAAKSAAADGERGAFAFGTFSCGRIAGGVL